MKPNPQFSWEKGKLQHIFLLLLRLASYEAKYPSELTESSPISNHEYMAVSKPLYK